MEKDIRNLQVDKERLKDLKPLADKFLLELQPLLNKLAEKHNCTKQETLYLLISLLYFKEANVVLDMLLMFSDEGSEGKIVSDFLSAFMLNFTMGRGLTCQVIVKEKS